MPKVDIFEVIANLSKLLDQVVNGEEIIITKTGKPVAIISHYPKTNKKCMLANIKDRL